MTKETRTAEIISAMKSFEREAYYKEELLPEYLALQGELVNLVFNDIHAECGNLRIWDVENHLTKLNEECNHAADVELETVRSVFKTIRINIKSEFSGKSGEIKAFRSLETLRSNNRVLKNIELCEDDRMAELDGIVITEKAIFVVEVKNPHSDVCIDENGNYGKVKDIMFIDCNIGEKMNNKVYLLKKALSPMGFKNPNIESLVVFTNSNIHVDNQYPYIKTCFLSSLPHIIDNYSGDDIYDDTDIDDIVTAVNKAEKKNPFPVPFDAKKFKNDFAALMVKLEKASEKRDEIREAVVETLVETKQEQQSAAKDEDANLSHEPIKNDSGDRKINALLNTLGAVGVFGLGFLASKAIKYFHH